MAEGAASAIDPALARDLVLDELFDLTLYQRLHAVTQGGLQKILSDLIPVETRHFTFWKRFFHLELNELDALRKIKLGLVIGACRLFGPTAVHLVLEAIEIYGVRKYLKVWDQYKGQPLGEAVREILSDEFEHEDTIVSRISERKIDPEKVRSIFLGFNDGLVEILGAVSGFFAAFGHSSMVLAAGMSVAVAGALSMAAGAFAAASSELEVRTIEEGKARFLGQAGAAADSDRASPPRSALIVGISYFLGAAVPVLPVLLGAANMWASVIAAGVMIMLVSLVLAFLSGMEIRKRIALNLAIITCAVSVTYVIGLFAKNMWGVSV